jgi:hypothetical protein
MIFRQLFEPLSGAYTYLPFMNYAMSGNEQCGVCPFNLPEDIEAYFRQMTESPQG